MLTLKLTHKNFNSPPPPLSPPPYIKFHFRPNQKNFSPTKWSFFLEYNFGTLILKKWKLCTKNSIISRLVELTAQKWTHRNHSKHSLGQMHLKHPFLVSPLSATTGGEFASPKPIGSVF